MNLKIFYNGEDISDSIDVQTCVTNDRYGGLLDSLQISVNDADGKWIQSGLSKGDEIIIKTDGYTTGAMYVVNINGKKGLFTIDAVSLKPSKKVVKSRIWRHVRLTEILNDCAGNNGLSLKTYGIIDYTYESVAQICKTDLEFASDVCKREGYSVKVDNNCLIVFNEYYLENQNADMKITSTDVKDNYRFVRSSNCTHSVTVSCYDIEKGLIEQTSTDEEMLGGSEIINEKVSTYDEAMRFAKGHLRERNKKNVLGFLDMPYNSKISAGTVFQTEGFGSFDGKYVVIEVAHDVKRELSKLTVRKVIGY